MLKRHNAIALHNLNPCPCKQANKIADHRSDRADGQQT